MMKVVFLLLLFGPNWVKNAPVNRLHYINIILVLDVTHSLFKFLYIYNIG